MDKLIECPYCGYQNHKEAFFCEECGKSLTGKRIQPGKQHRGLVSWITNKANKVIELTDEFLDVFSSQSSTQAAPMPIMRSQPETIQTDSGLNHKITLRSPQKVQPKQPGTTISYFQILETIPLAFSNYYKVYGIRCENCQSDNFNSKDLKCTHCQTPLRKFVLRESSSKGVLPEAIRERIISLSENISGVLKHNRIFYLNGIQYILLDGFPEPWFSMGKEGVLPVHENQKIIPWLTQIGNALKGLHQLGYFYYDENKRNDWVESILVLKNQQAYLADISGMIKAESNMDQAVQKDISFLGKVLYTFVTGSRQNIPYNTDRSLGVTAAVNDLIMKALNGRFSTVDDFLTSLQQTPKEPEVVRSLRQLVGYGTDVGKKRDHNEDYVSKFSLGLEQIPGTPEVGLYIVADGMGGHQAGEKASESVIRDVVINRIQEQMQQLQAVPKLKRATIKLDDVLTPGEILREAIIRANQVLLSARKASSGRDRGTTITAALIVGNTSTIANVGDSRTYLMRDNQLVQITQDHSLVASLVASKMITPGEVRSHPQRNQIYRTLGDKPQIEVDIFHKTLKPGDQLLLCSDGLWEMVLDDEIEKIMRNSRTPQSACDRLIEEANLAGGDDNISVIVVWLE